MNNVKYALTNNKEIPANITANGHITPVWIQQRWEQGEYAKYIQRNGCGHCCVAMALNLCGINITPHDDGKVLIANSSCRAETDEGIQLVDCDILAVVLYEGCEPKNFTWGRYALENSGGYVVVG